VLELTAEGLVVTEIAPGVDLQKDVLDRCEFPLIVSEDLRTMDLALFADAPSAFTFRRCRCTSGSNSAPLPWPRTDARPKRLKGPLT
jgi:acyl CoA:acetate/3-ketoacid CoA transferase